MELPGSERAFRRGCGLAGTQGLKARSARVGARLARREQLGHRGGSLRACETCSVPTVPRFDEEESLAPRCACPIGADQLPLFEVEALDSSPVRQWPAIETSACGRIGFWYRRSPSLFLGRRGVGPLILCPDTSVLIWMLENLDAVEDGGFGVPAGPLIADTWDQPLEAIRDLLQLWFWRDVRFFVGNAHLEDSRRPLSEARRRSRARAPSKSFRATCSSAGAWTSGSPTREATRRWYRQSSSRRWIPSAPYTRRPP